MLKDQSIELINNQNHFKNKMIHDEYLNKCEREQENFESKINKSEYASRIISGPQGIDTSRLLTERQT